MTQNNCIALLWTLRSFSARVLQAVIDSHGERKVQTQGTRAAMDDWISHKKKLGQPCYFFFLTSSNFTGILLIYHHLPSFWKQIFFFLIHLHCVCPLQSRFLEIPFWVQAFESKTHVKFNCESIIGKNASHNDISEPEPNVFPLSIDQANYRKAFIDPLLNF